MKIGETEARIIPYPKSSYISDIDWAPMCTISRLATGEATRDGSDLWPITWGDDDHLYTAYGDGYGFEPSLPIKLGLGFAKVVGPPNNFMGENIRSNGENSGYGKSGKKANGLLMVDGILYMYVRSVDGDGNHCQLAWSEDYGNSWKWSTWIFEEFGLMSFINYGKNYSGARDEYVYMFFHNHPNVRVAADCFVMARVNKDKIKDRNAYEFIKEFNAEGEPIWTKDINERGVVFKDPSCCARVSISYNQGVGRYLMWQQIPYPTFDTRFVGGFAIYEAPEPWGPWKNVYYTEKWDVGPGEQACFPTKWMSCDGKELYLVFSGNDNFSVRKATLVMGDEG